MDRIKVVGPDMMCWPVDAVTLEALACSHYDPYAWVTPDPKYTETISMHEWYDRRKQLKGDD